MRSVQGILKVESDTRLSVLDEARLRSGLVDTLVRDALLGRDVEASAEARWMLRQAALALGIFPASILPLYGAIGRGKYGGFTVPALNLRMLPYDSARAAFRAARRARAGALVFELARSEMGYTAQRPADYATAITAAAIKEGWRGPLFIQGDHFQFQPSRYRSDPRGEAQAIQDLIKDSLAAGFYNIDIDASTLVDLSRPTLEAQQELNCKLSAEMTRFIRSLQPEGVNVSIGGEIGEVGGRNSTEADLRAYMRGYLAILGGRTSGISKVSVQTGTSHGGTVLPDGTIAQVKVDFDTLRRLSKLAREEYGMGGAVQHGASTLPEEAFHKFPEAGCVEIHLATGFMNRILDSRHFPPELRDQMYRWTFEHQASARKQGETDEQFIYRNRKYAVGPFKAQAMGLPQATRDAIAGELEELFNLLFTKLQVTATEGTVREAVPPVAIYPSLAEEKRRGAAALHPAAHDAREAGE